MDQPISDAKALYNILTKKYTFNNKDIIFLKNPTRKEIFNAFDSLEYFINENDNLLIYYAGNGWWDENVEIGYWLPSDAEI